ncbi:transcriptional regulator [Arenicella chitinivorans]|uniref:Transcriptional regulator n=1 Tax=Arenicella chitinivorans TaxID=1329800 RepID=A0A918RHS8_9GAMM|nr:helix-turn-helix transcriptional regulator [Arenicella chitinivorans]GGZ98639.1 transcriptional regulator [Arenicella chitinivorans]
MEPETSKFTQSLKAWRKNRKLSQLELALAADVSQRHVSWLETGRSKPSREMVLRLSAAMEVPLRERNTLLNAAGFADVYREQQLDDPAMASIKTVLAEILKHHEPYPAFVLDRYWNIQQQNYAADRMFDMVGGAEALWQAVGDTGERNIALLTVHPHGFKQFVQNWDDVAIQFAQRLQKEALDSCDERIMRRLEQLSAYLPQSDVPTLEPLLPIIPIELNVNGLHLSLCSVISTFGTAQDITADELRVETFYPANEHTADFLAGKV